MGKAGKGKAKGKTFGGLAGFLATLNAGSAVSESLNQPQTQAASMAESDRNGGDGEEVDEDRPGKRRKVEIEKAGQVDHVTAVGVNVSRSGPGLEMGNDASGIGGSGSSVVPVVLSRTVVKTKRRTQEEDESWEGEGTEWIERYDMSAQVRHLERLEDLDVPLTEGKEGLRKYFAQRYKLFSLYSSAPGCLLDEEGWYSVTPEAVARRIAERCRCDTIIDAFCGVGGNAIQFALTCNRVITFDTSLERLQLARHNAMIYGVEGRIEFVLGDFVSWARSFVHREKRNEKRGEGLGGGSSGRKIDVVFLSPPWGGPDYLGRQTTTSSGEIEAKDIESGGVEEEEEEARDTEHASYTLSSIQPIHGADLFRLSREITPNVAYYLPRNMDLEEISGLLVKDQNENVEVEEEWTGKGRNSKLKALTCYFGGLVYGQEHIF
ncbi:hypothetical protein K435DRAFT_972729 [Dendrothele bispora CBS 962.96]|uniref:Trimethylguanosine synthase n=1 Tax=Dendrothele bispora (strain CBS 962.96) TaxID=1314807 RepID=A0A4S8KX15_DENBC|nr:hypothetical protein K435DRAFT_972729 [Dendrothele bispora CBS 962.96]